MSYIIGQMATLSRKAEPFAKNLYLLLAGTELNGYAPSLLPATAFTYRVSRQVFERLNIRAHLFPLKIELGGSLFH